MSSDLEQLINLISETNTQGENLAYVVDALQALHEKVAKLTNLAWVLKTSLETNNEIQGKILASLGIS